MSSRAAQALLLVAAAAAWGFGANALRSTPLPLAGELGPPPTREAGADLAATTPEGAIATWEAGGFFVDVRDRSEFDARRIDGALSLPAAQLHSRYADALGSLTLEMPLIVYGAGPDSFEVRHVAAELLQLGHSRVDVVVSGVERLLTAGAPLAEGPTPP